MWVAKWMDVPSHPTSPPLPKKTTHFYGHTTSTPLPIYPPQDLSIQEWLSLNFEIQEHNKFGTIFLLLRMWSGTPGFHIWRKRFFFFFWVFCFVDHKVAPYIHINFLLSCYKFSINSVLGTYLIWKHLPSTILICSTMCSHGTCTHVHASNTKNESYRKGLERTSRSHSFLRQSVMGIVSNPHGHPTKSVSSKNPIPHVTIKIKILDWLNSSAVVFMHRD